MPGVDALADELARFAAACRAAGERELLKEVRNGIKKAADGIPAEIRAGLRPHLPDRYADVLNADLKITVSVRTGQDAGVTIQATAPTPYSRRGRAVNAINAGNLRHPVYAQGPRRSWHWKDQDVRPGWFTDPNQAAQPRVRQEIAAALDRVWADIWAVTHG